MDDKAELDKDVLKACFEQGIMVGLQDLFCLL